MGFVVRVVVWKFTASSRQILSIEGAVTINYVAICFEFKSVMKVLEKQGGRELVNSQDPNGTKDPSIRSEIADRPLFLGFKGLSC